MDDELRLPLVGRVISRFSGRAWIALDIAVAVVIVVPVIAETAARSDLRLSGTGWDAVRYAGTGLLAVALPFRRRYPIGTLAVILPGAMVALALQVDPPSLTVLIALAVYSVTAVSKPRTSQVTLVVVVVGALLALSAAGGSRLVGNLISTTAFVLAAWLAGENTRSRRIYTAAVAERARNAAEREARLRRAVADERVVIARELHDIVAHAMSVIAVRSGVARMVLESQPDEAREALGIIETTTRRALQEMRLLVGVLRAADGSGTELNPAPGLAGVGALVDEAGHAGVKVSVEIDGDVRPLPAGADLSAYRIIQEALTNVVRHAGPTRASLRIGYGADEITIDVVDEGGLRWDRPHPDPEGSGHGLIGMRERAALYGGTLTTGPDGHGFGVHARLSTSEVAR